MFFKDRQEAAQKLVEKLSNHQNSDAIVYALPRGGVVVGTEIAKALNLKLDLLFVRKIAHPYNPEYAICAISEQGIIICSPKEVAYIDKNWLQKTVEEEETEISRRRREYLKDRPLLNCKDKIAILVDDGIATGLTMRVAIGTIKKMNPKKIIVAAPIMPKDFTQSISTEVDEVIAVEIPEFFLGSVGGYYDNFPQLTDDQIKNILKFGPI